MNFGISYVTSNALAVRTVICGITQGIYTTNLLKTSFDTNSLLVVAIHVVSTFVITCATRWRFINDAFTERCLFVAMFNWAYAATAFIDNETAFQCTHTASSLVNFVSLFRSARFTFTITIDCVRWRTNTVAISIANIAFV